MEIQHAIAVVSGGASGMGAATAARLSAAGAKVAILDRDFGAAKQFAATLKNALPVHCDVTDAEQVETAIQSVIAQLGLPRICINCAGIVHSQRMVGKTGPMPLDVFRQVIEVNLIGTFNLMRIAAAAMMQTEPQDPSGERGVIINTSSIAAEEGQIGQIAYSASKGGVDSMTLPAARELASFGIRVNTIAPGLVDTPMLHQLTSEQRAALINSIPFPKRPAYPDEYAKLILHIIDNPMLNGMVVRLDGALRMQAK